MSLYRMAAAWWKDDYVMTLEDKSGLKVWNYRKNDMIMRLGDCDMHSCTPDPQFKVRRNQIHPCFPCSYPSLSQFIFAGTFSGSGAGKSIFIN